jgi:hypothetical protein
MANQSGSESSAQDAARQEPKHKTTKPSGEEAPRQTISPDEKSRRFVAGLKQRFEEKKTNREATSDRFDSIEEELFAPRNLPPNNPGICSAQRRKARRNEIRSDENPVSECRCWISDTKASRVAVGFGTATTYGPTLCTRRNKYQARRGTAFFNKSSISKHSGAGGSHIQAFDTPPIENTLTLRHRANGVPSVEEPYNSELLAYCAYHEVALVDADAPIVTEPPPAKSNLLIVLVIIAAASGALAGLFIINRLFPVSEPVTTSPALPQRPGNSKRNTRVK